ncbi:covalently-linked cell wall protein [Ophiostoma piceae UAMH 11346]|uniref:Covalently-linked cell wall protein n=1 Tax=Ophiostoma piceae (strain UAMH 11346) TaxID=1262450 RepID=S3CQ56_OPHP1|nr:covalently-linked cell wall protein [Ophiostoma piceae UAMH 11346]
MKSTLALISLFGSVALAGGVTDEITPDNSYPQGCSKAFSGNFQVTVATIKESAKRDVHQHMKRDTCGTDGALLLTLEDGVLSDAKNRTGYIASNYQFQFDGPPQAGAIYTAGFSICGNDSLALGDTTTWYQCKSGDFYNLYDRNWAAQCEPVQIIAMACGDSSSGGVHESSDGQIVATQVITTTIVKPLSDGQPQVLTTTIPVPICQIGDGQIQGHTTPCASITPTTTATPNTGVPVSQYSDGQIQVTTPAPTATEPATTEEGTTPAATTPAATTPAATTPAVTAPSVTTPAGTAPPGTAPAGGATTPVTSGSFKTTTSKGGNFTIQTSTGTGSSVPGTGSSVPGTSAPGSSASASTTAISTSEGLRISAGSMAAMVVSLFAAYLAL